MERTAVSGKQKKNNYAEGFQRFYDFGGVTRHDFQIYDVFCSSSSFARDRDSLLSDWRNVGSDLQNAIIKFREQING